MPVTLGRHRTVLILLLLATLLAAALAMWAAFEIAPRGQSSGGNSLPYTFGATILLLGAGLVLALGLVPVGAVAGAALAKPGASRLPAGTLGAVAGFSLAILASFGAVLILESVARRIPWPLLSVLLALPFVAGALVGVAALRLRPGVAGPVAAVAATVLVLTGLMVLRLLGI